MLFFPVTTYSDSRLLGRLAAGVVTDCLIKSSAILPFGHLALWPLAAWLFCYLATCIICILDYCLYGFLAI